MTGSDEQLLSEVRLAKYAMHSLASFKSLNKVGQIFPIFLAKIERKLTYWTGVL